MEVEPTPLPGLVVLRPVQHHDERGSFTRVWDVDAFAAAGLGGDLRQLNASWNRSRGTLRGLHWQDEPHAETKLVRCTRGRVFDVAVDVRADSPTRYRWFGTELSPAGGAALYIPTGFAHGFLTLEDDSQVEYVMTADYAPHASRGLRWDDPRLSIDWPEDPRVISGRDAEYPLLADG